MDTLSENTQANGKEQVAPSRTSRNVERDAKAQAELDMLYKLKSGIDQNGSFKYRLNDLSTGYAAGRGVNAMEARAEIIQKFEKQFGKDPMDYMNDLYQKRQEMTQGNGRSSRRGR